VSKNIIINKNSLDYDYIKKSNQTNLLKKFDKIYKNITKFINLKKDSFHVLSKNFKINFNVKDLKNFQKFNHIVIIGMGGSILGSETIFNFLNHKIKKRVYFLNDINEIEILKLKKNIIKNKTLFLVISKSGNTIETIVNFISLNVIRNKSKNIILISDKKNNNLHSLAKTYNLFYIEHKSYVSGRYSVLSEVGLVPAYLFGLNIKKLRLNSQKFLNKKNNLFLKDSSAKLANLVMQRRFNNLILLNYAPKLEKFLYWFQQLIAESLGKKKIGLLPTISNAPKDHHSLLQLYLDGPKDKIFHIFSVEEKSKIKIRTDKFSNSIEYLNNKNLNKIKIAQKNALINTLKKKKIPFRETIIKKNDEQTLGELFSYYILEVAIIGKLIDIDPFNQPAVEQVKMTTKKILT
tara:strand:+ start:1675 stop:2892 length:1218 start_codon:yes stop_codon:yes gene_type:complete